jgi:hypothetical protein
MHYRTPFWRIALGGMIAGALFYFFPFLISALAFVFLVGLMFRLVFGFGRWGGHWHMRAAYAEQWRNMTEEQRAAMRAKYAHYRGCGCHGPMDLNAPTTPTTPTNA